MTDSSSAENAVLVFDWGNTLMKVFPEYSGPMANWPEVAEVEGASSALNALFGQHTMVVATNAGDSDAEQVWKALQRGGLGSYFRAVFTSQELRSRKPELPFFRQIQSVLAHPAHQMVMVGDDYRVDVLGAKAAGWQTIWYNPGYQTAPGQMPLHDAEIEHLDQLPQALGRLSLPDYTTCLAWLTERGAPHNILTHVQLVAAIAYQLAVWLRARGEAIDPVLTQRAALLHDVAKMDSIRLKKERGEHGDHADMARTFLLERGQPELAQIADRHMIYKNPDDPRRPRTWEEKLVHFADKLAEGSQLVSLEERRAALQARYPDFAREIQGSIPILNALQNEICDHLAWSPEEMLNQLRQTSMK